jgi:hypothetical protein
LTTSKQFVQADTLRSDIERPPFGWDPNTVKVGLALLLRASACRLIDNSRTLMDPADNDVILALTKEAKFRNLRVQGVRSDLTMDELRAIRGYIEALFTVNVERRELRLRWADMVSAARIESDADLEQVLEALRRRLQAQIDDDTALILE